MYRVVQTLETKKNGIKRKQVIYESESFDDVLIVAQEFDERFPKRIAVESDKPREKQKKSTAPIGWMIIMGICAAFNLLEWFIV